MIMIDKCGEINLDLYGGILFDGKVVTEEVRSRLGWYRKSNV
jgi:hypothetical protein